MGKKIKESINSRISSKKYWRTFEQQSYRDELARNLKEMRKEWDKEGMNRLLVKEKDGHDSGYKYFKSIQTSHGRKPSNALAKKLIKEEYWKNWIIMILNNLSAFSWLDKDIWIKIACTDFGHYHWRWHWIIGVMKHIDKFQWLDVNMLINEYIKRFNETAKTYHYRDEKEQEYNLRDMIGLWISKYKWPNINKETAKMLIHNWASWCITDYNYIDKFEWLDEEIANLLTAKGYWKFVKAHPEKFWLKKKKIKNKK